MMSLTSERWENGKGPQMFFITTALLIVALAPAGLRLMTGVIAIIFAATMWSARRRHAHALIVASETRRNGAWNDREAGHAEHRLLAASLRNTMSVTCLMSLLPNLAVRCTSCPPVLLKI
jgi:hypothetical protein